MTIYVYTPLKTLLRYRLLGLPQPSKSGRQANDSIAARRLPSATGGQDLCARREFRVKGLGFKVQGLAKILNPKPSAPKP